MKKLTILSLLIVSILISGCAKKEPQIIYKEAPYYDFQTVDFKNSYIESKKTTIVKEKLNKKIKINLNSDEVMQVCKPLLQELNTIYKETKAFYDEQIQDYKTINKSKN